MGSRTCKPAITEADQDFMDPISRAIRRRKTGQPVSRIPWKPPTPRSIISKDRSAQKSCRPDGTSAQQLSGRTAHRRDEGDDDCHAPAAHSRGVELGRAMGMLAAAPEIQMPKRAKGRTLMRGRPITAEEFERMLTAAKTIRPRDWRTWNTTSPVYGSRGCGWRNRSSCRGI